MEGDSTNDYAGLLRRGLVSKSSLSPEKSLQQRFEGGSFLRSVSCESDDSQDRRNSPSGSDQEDITKRKLSHTSSTEDSPLSSVQDSDKHVGKKPRNEVWMGHEYNDVPMKMMVNTMDAYSVFTHA